MVVAFLLTSLIWCLFGLPQTQSKLAVCGDVLCYEDQPVFLSGMNIAWHSFAYDFGNNNWDKNSGVYIEQYVRDIAAAGGNSMRIWIHCTGGSTPEFDNDGFVVATDGAGTLIDDLRKLLDIACSVGILVFPVLWSGAGDMKEPLQGLVWDEDKLQSYIDNALHPIIDELNGHPGLGAWEIINEPEGSMINDRYHENPCFDTTVMKGTGMGWTNTTVPIEQMMKFINWQLDAIRSRSNDMAFVGSWSGRSQTDEFGYRNYYTDECLRDVENSRYDGIIDFYCMHTYDNKDGVYIESSPMENPNSAFNLDKPNLIGEFSEEGGAGYNITYLFDHAYNNGYSGAWSWQANGGGSHADDFATQARGLSYLADKDDGRISIIDGNIC